MSKLERFFFISAIIGLVGDVIGLITFFGGLWNTTPQGTSTGSGLPVLAQVIMVLVAIYGWFIIGLALIGRRAPHLKDNPISIDEMASGAAFGVGILVAPILIGLWIAIAQANIEGGTEELRENSIVHATQTAQAYQATVTANPSTPVYSIYQPKTVAELMDEYKSNWRLGYIIGGIMLLILLSIGMWGSLFLLAPYVYPEFVYEDYEDEESTPPTKSSLARSPRRNK